ncbi:hypothetical protein JKF63_06319 [Porcisia hertigi]|uniref:DNA/RNA non-specific endonuclease n=1 Tax=Porcisia hertigi TaxID=2761500 RepID=A0A836LF16_9TRYP|nr:hypothetical protein JKF63_06319 [Porcisia hertigi]
MLPEHTCYTSALPHGARAHPKPRPPLFLDVPTFTASTTLSWSFTVVWLTCATAAIAGACGVIVGARLLPWLNCRTTRLYNQREAKHRNPLLLLPSPTAVTQPRWWRWLCLASASRKNPALHSVGEARRLDRGHAAEWLVACTGHLWLPQRISQPTLLRLYSPVRSSRQGCTDRDTNKEIQWGTYMLNRAAHPLLKRPTVATATKSPSTSCGSWALSALARLTRAPLQQWQPLPQHMVDVFVSTTPPGTEKPCATAPAAASPLICLPRQGFALLYDPVARLSVWCGYFLTQTTVERARQQSRYMTFFTDRSLAKSARRVPVELRARGYDRGHLAPHASVAGNTQTAIEAALLSNVQLQHCQINRGVWRWLETATRAYVRQRSLADAPCAVSSQLRHARTQRVAGAVGPEAAHSSEAARSREAGPPYTTPHRGAGRACRRRRRPLKSASGVSLSPIPGSSTCGSAAKWSGSAKGVRQGSLRDGGELITRLLALSDVESGASVHLTPHDEGARGCVPRITRCCQAWWRRLWLGSAPPCSFHLGRQVAVNVGPLYFRQAHHVEQVHHSSRGAAAVRGCPATAAVSSATISLAPPPSSPSRRANQRQRSGDTVLPPKRSLSSPSESLYIPDAFFFSLWDVHTHQHVHLVVPNHPDAAAVRAVTAAVAARRPAAAAAAAAREAASKSSVPPRQCHLATHPPPPTSSSDDLEMALRSLAVSTLKLEELFAESLVELRSRCISVSVPDAARRRTSASICHGLSPVALRTRFRFYPVYRQRWMWQCTLRRGGQFLWQSSWRHLCVCLSLYVCVCVVYVRPHVWDYEMLEL